MPVLNSIAQNAENMTQWRQYLHQNPELCLDCNETAQFVSQKLAEFGVDQIDHGWARTGVVGLIKGRAPGPVIALRADMDALPIVEETGLDYASKNEGKMHACGHDGHTAMLLGAAQYLAETRNFAGTVALIFQPAEETKGGAGIMCNEGLMDKYDIQEIYAMHNLPDLPVGQFETCAGPIMAASTDFFLDITGKGGHAAFPHECNDPIVVANALYQAIQSIVSRNVMPTDTCVISVSQFFGGGTATNIIPETARLGGTIRSFDNKVQAMAKTRMQEIANGIAQSFGATIDISFGDGYPATTNHVDQTAFAVSVARDLVGQENVTDQAQPTMGSEDFAFMLDERPGSYLFIGNGASAPLHHPKFNFNDEILPIGASFFASLVENSPAHKLD